MTKKILAWAILSPAIVLVGFILAHFFGEFWQITLISTAIFIYIAAFSWAIGELLG